MIPYIFLFILIFLLFLEHKSSQRKLAGFNWFLLFFAFILFVGLRYNTGGDFEIYYELYQKPKEVNTQFFYNLISQFFYNLNLPFQYLIFICACLFFYALFKYALLQNSPYLVIFISFPFLITVVSMGYLRQSISFSFLLLAINSFYKKNNFFYYLNFFLGILFHLSLLIMLPLKQFAEKSNIFFFIISFIIFIIIFYIFYDAFFILINSYYVSSSTISSLGAFPRVLLNVIPSIIFIIFYKKFLFPERIKRLYLFIALGSIISLVFVFNFSTLVDRINIYFIPIQLFVYSNMSNLFREKLNYNFVILSVLIIYFVYFFAWAFFGSFSAAWFPYKNILFEL